MTLHLEQFNDTVIRTTYEEFPLLMPRWGYVASAFVLFLIGFFGFFLNLMVILLMFKDRQLWTPLNIILFNLVCSDFSVSLLGNPFTLISALFHHWIFGHTLCVLYGFFMALLGITSITTLTVISFERYMMVTKPFSSRHLTSKGAVLSIVFIWAYALALTMPPLFGWGNYENEAANISCSVNWHEQSFNTLTYILFLFAMGQILPFAIITFSYVNIIRTMRKNSQRLGRVNRAEARATAMVLLMIISFTVSWTPYSLFALMEQFATEGIVSPGAGVIPALVAKSSICYDPLIYVGMNTQFRQSIKRVFSMPTKCRNSETDRGYNNTFLSPSHKLSVFKDTTLQNSSETSLLNTPKKISKSEMHLDGKINITINDKGNKHIHKVPKLCLIDEKMTVSDAEKSGETIFDDDTSNSNRKLEIFGESCKLNDHSPILTIVDSNKLCFTKVPKRENDKQLYEEQFPAVKKTDNTDHSFKRTKTIKHSCSLDLGGISHEGKRRKFSIETKFESNFAPKSFMGTVVSKFFEQNVKHDNIKTYLCENQDNQGNEESS
ncbi:PREDICTED: parapinopsin-like [Papilio xuthus]|uniref:Parapinopsin-like n=1 Tax=Papilio xuthus TaxID=66420 RepID=A0AAJ6YZ91_PAPXU|nr:PREDICTED: parapinopsin-like [Papilio xuthus]